MEQPLIVCDPKVLLGKPVIAGTRISVELILEKLGSGESIDQILAEHPRLTREAVLAAIRYAVKVMRFEIVHPLDAKSA